MMEAVAGYPCAVEQKKIVHKQVLALTETEAIQREKNHSPEDPIIHFQKELGKSLAESENKNELIDILKRKLLHVSAQKDHKNAPQDHLKLLDNFIHSDMVKQFNMPKKKAYLSSRITEAIEETSGMVVPEK